MPSKSRDLVILYFEEDFIAKHTNHSSSVCFLCWLSALQTRLDLKYEEAKFMADKYEEVDYRDTKYSQVSRIRKSAPTV